MSRGVGSFDGALYVTVSLAKKPSYEGTHLVGEADIGV